jgi:hypothetical protein
MFVVAVLGVTGQRVECALPKAAVMKDPLLGLLERLGSQSAAMHPAIHCPFHQAGALQHADMS